MNEIISGIKVIKMYAWERAFKKLVTEVRLYVQKPSKSHACLCTIYTALNTICRKESVINQQGGVIRASGAGLIIISLTLLMFLVFTVFTATGGELTPRNIFTTLSLLITLRVTSVDYMVLNILSMSEFKVVITRLQVGQIECLKL